MDVLTVCSLLPFRCPSKGSYQGAMLTEPACAGLQREWIEQQQKVQGVQEAAWPEHIYENFFIVVS
jgi:hypothetical protein